MELNEILVREQRHPCISNIDDNYKVALVCLNWENGWCVIV